MAYAIMRFQKLKTFGSVSGVAGHHTRDHHTPNANPSRMNQWLVGPASPSADDIVAAVRDRIGERKIRKNGVIAAEFVLTASPEFFRPNAPTLAGHYDPDKVDAFNRVALDWLRRTFGADNLVSLVCHLDEATPHLQAVVVPLDPDTGRLNAARWFNGRKALSELQDGFATACWSLGLERGIRGSRATHTRIAEYYSNVNAASDHPMPSVAVEVPPSMLLGATRDSWAEAETRRVNDEVHDAVRPVADVASSARLARQKQKEAEATAKTLAGELERLRQDAALVRDIPLADVLARSGYAEETPGEWCGPAGSITVQVKSGKPRFYNVTREVGGRNAIDLVRHLHGLNSQDAITWLGRQVGHQAAVGAALERAKQMAREAMKSTKTLALKDWNTIQDAHRDAQDMGPSISPNVDLFLEQSPR